MLCQLNIITIKTQHYPSKHPTKSGRSGIFSGLSRLGYVKGESAHAINILLGRKKKTIWAEGLPELLTRFVARGRRLLRSHKISWERERRRTGSTSSTRDEKSNVRSVRSALVAEGPGEMRARKENMQKPENELPSQRW